MFKWLKNFIKNNFFNTKWRCNICNVEVFDGEYFCKSCYKELPFNDGAICDHCGRKVSQPTLYCSTCKERLLSIDKSRSVFVYDKAIKALIKKAKYDRKTYLIELFAKYMSFVYFKSYFNADYLCYIPMTKKALRKRGYNQSKILADNLSERINVPVINAISKVKDTTRQATLNRAERLKNLEGAFIVTDKKSIKDKVLVIIDDVTTTGATAENVAKILKRAGASKVYLLTVASVPPKQGY